MPFTLIKTPAQGGHGTPARWDFAFDDILSYRNNRLIVMQNWDSLWQNDGAQIETGLQIETDLELHNE